MSNKTALIIDDEQDIAEFVSEVALISGINEVTTINSTEFEDSFRDDYDFIVLDLYMPELDGIELLRRLGKYNCKSAIILMSGKDDRVLESAIGIAEAYNLNVKGALTKPIRLGQLEKLFKKVARLSEESDVTQQVPLTVKDLEHAIENEELILQYQPQVELQSMTTIGFEALVRWQHPRLGLLEPNSFIPFAEKSGIINKITWKVLDMALRQLAALKKHGYEIRMSVNMSASDLDDFSLPEKIMLLLVKYNLSPKQLNIEITESKIHEDMGQSLDILTRLRMKGINLSIDDFGTGYSTFEQLKRFPFNELKVDKSFILDCLSNRQSEAIAASTIALGHRLNMHVLAEGVESELVMDFLRKMGCDQAQGFFIRKPIASDDCREFLEAG